MTTGCEHSRRAGCQSDATRHSARSLRKKAVQNLLNGAWLVSTWSVCADDCGHQSPVCIHDDEFFPVHCACGWADTGQRSHGRGSDSRAGSSFLSIGSGRSTALPGRHVGRRGAREVDRHGGVPARKDLGIRRHRHLGVGRLQRRVHRGSGRARREQRRRRRSRSSTSPISDSCCTTARRAQIYFRLFSYARYLNQRSLDPTYVDSFGNTKTVQLRQDIQLQKFFAPFSGWFLTPKFRYYLYVWSSNPSQGDPAQVVGAGNLSYTFNRFVDVRRRHHVAAGRAEHRRAVPVLAQRRQSPDRRRILQRLVHRRRVAQGRAPAKLKYMAMIANNLSVLGVSATQLDNKLDTQSFMLAVAADDRRVWPVRNLRRLRRPSEGRDQARRAFHPQPRRRSRAARHERDREQPDPTDRRQRHLHARSLRPRHRRRDRRLPDDEHRRRHQVSRPVARRRVLPALADRLHRPQHRQASPTSPTTAISCSRRRWSFRRCCRCISAGRRFLAATATRRRSAPARNWYFTQAARPARQRRMDSAEQLSGRIHRRSLSGRRQRQRCFTSTSR